MASKSGKPTKGIRHVLIIGTTGTGKTTLAKKLCRGYADNDVGTIVYDPIGDEWGADYQTDDAELFQECFWKSERCAVFIDESGDVLGQHDTYMRPVLTRGRHRGHVVHVISQRGAMLSPTVRDQCGILYMFQTSRKDCDVHANDWVCEDLRNGHKLAHGEYMRLERLGSVTKGNAFE